MKRRTKIFGILAILIILLALPIAVLAAPVGKVSSLEGNVDLTAAGKVQPLKIGDPVNAGDILRSKSKSKAEVTFLDGNILRLAENTRIRITDYQSGEGKTTTLDLFRGKTQNIITGLVKNARYEIHTPTAIVGVRGTDFIAFFQNGVSGFIPKEGTIYGYNRNMPTDVKIVTPGQAIMVFAADKPPVVQPATSAEVQKHIKETTLEEKKEEKEKEKKDEGGTPPVKETAPPPAPPPPPPPPPPTVPATVPTTVPTTVTTTVTTTVPTTVATTVRTTVPTTVPVTVATTVPPTPIITGSLSGGAITKVVTGTIRQSNYSSLYKIPQGIYPGGGEFLSAGGTNYLRVRYEDMYFDDGIGTNRGYRFEQVRNVVQGGQSAWTQDRQRWYLPSWPNPVFVTFVHDGGLEGIRERGRTNDLFPNLDLAAAPTNGGGASATHPLFFGTVGNAASFAANYTVGSPGTGTFIKTLDLTIPNASGREKVGTFTGTLGIFGSTPTALWSSSSSAAPATMTLSGAFTHDAGYEGSAFRGTVGFSSDIDKYVETTPGYGGAYYGQIAGYLPDTGSTVPMKGNLYSLYIYNPDATTNKAGVIAGKLTPGAGTTASPETGTWKAEGTLNRITPLEINNSSGITAATLSANVVVGRAGVDATAGFYNPTGAPRFALGMGHGSISSIPGIDAFGIFSLGHNLLNRYENASTQSVWETSGWGEFGRYQRTDSPSQNYMDYGYWYADLNSNKSWANNQLSADFNGRFLTLLKYGTMTGQTAGSYGADGTWGAGSQGYWQKGGDLAFASQINGSSFSLNRTKQKYFVSGNSLYQYSLNDPKNSTNWGGRSYYYDAVSKKTTLQNFNVYGPKQEGTYSKETWTTVDGGATWSYVGTQYADEAAYRAALGALGTPPSGNWMVDSSSDRYELWTGQFNGIMGGLNAGLWTGKTSPLKFQGSFDATGNNRISPSVSLGEIVSVNPLASSDGKSNSELAIGGAYRGMVGIAVDSTSAVAGNLIGLYQEKAGGYGGVIYSDNIKGAVHPQVGAWDADGTLNVYPFTSAPLTGDPKLFGGSLIRTDSTKSYNSGDVRYDVISGGRPDQRISQTTNLAIPGQPWGLWYRTTGGTITGGTAGMEGSRIERHEGEASPRGGTISTYGYTKTDAPVNGLFTGTSAGAETRLDELDQAGSKKSSYTMVFGGVIKGLFDPSTPATWTAVGQGSGMETSAFMGRQSAMDDAAKVNFERAMKIPAFDVGTANLRGNDGNLYVNVDGIKFFRFQNEADPRIWATDKVYGSYTSNPSVGTLVNLASSGSLLGLNETFEVKQWNTGGNNNWGAAIYPGSASSGGTLARSTADAARAAAGNLPAGASASITIGELRGGAAGVMTPGVNTYGLPGTSSFSGTAAGTVAGAVATGASHAIDIKFDPAAIPVKDVYGNTVGDLRSEKMQSISTPGQPQSEWSGTAGGTFTASTPLKWIMARETGQFAFGGTGGGEYLSFNLTQPDKAGISDGTVVGAQAVWGDPSPPIDVPSAYTVVMGGSVKGVFGPDATPKTWTTVSQGGFMETNAFLTRSYADDAARANFEKAMKIPAFDVGMANLRGNDGNLYVNMDGIKFFRFQNGAIPLIWATNNVYGSFVTNPALNTKVQLSSSGDLAGLQHTFEVKQWNAGASGSWGAAIYRGSASTGGTLTRGAADTARLSSGTSATIPITELRGGAAGVISAGTNPTGLPGTGSFSGTAAGTVAGAVATGASHAIDIVFQTPLPVTDLAGNNAGSLISENMQATDSTEPSRGGWTATLAGSYTAAEPVKWAMARETGPFATGGTGGGEYLSFSLTPPDSAGNSAGTAAGAQAVWGDPNPPAGASSAYTVVMGGTVKGLFDPSTTPKSWLTISQGGFMETNAFLRSSFADDAARANFEKTMKIPAFDVGMANLRGNDGNLYVNMDGVKFFRFQSETNPRIWATNNVYGSFTADPSLNTKVQLTSSGDLAGLKQTFEVKQWNAGGNNTWGASIYRGAADTGGTLTRSATDAARAAGGYLPAGAPAAMPIAELRGGAAGVINPGANTTGLPGTKSFNGTAAGTVR